VVLGHAHHHTSESQTQGAVKITMDDYEGSGLTKRDQMRDLNSRAILIGVISLVGATFACGGPSRINETADTLMITSSDVSGLGRCGAEPT
jgi:hypothetical protein